MAIEEIIPSPKRDETLPPLMYIIRSFDTNKPGTEIEDLEGGIIGGTINQGKFMVGDEIEIRPGISIEKEGKNIYSPLISEIVSLQAGEANVKEATCGGLVGVGTLLDPSYSKADGLTGNIAGKTGMLPPTLTELTLETHVLERAVGTKELLKIERINFDETLLPKVQPLTMSHLQHYMDAAFAPPTGAENLNRGKTCARISKRFKTRAKAGTSD